MERSKQKPQTLDELYEMMRNDDPDLPPWDDLPTFGGSPVEHTVEVWSWDATRKIIGTCSDDIEIVDRSEEHQTKQSKPGIDPTPGYNEWPMHCEDGRPIEATFEPDDFERWWLAGMTRSDEIDSGDRDEMYDAMVEIARQEGRTITQTESELRDAIANFVETWNENVESEEEDD